MKMRAAPVAKLVSELRELASGDFGVRIPPSWLQGTATYGGCSAALCLAGAKRVLERREGAASPPLRSAQIAFIGSLGEEGVIRPLILRQGKSMTFVRSEALSKGPEALATTALFAFGARRESAFDQAAVEAPPSVPDAAASPPLFSPDLTPPSFTQHFEALLARGSRPATASADSEHYYWVRHVGSDEQGLITGVDTDVSLLALADMPPPAMVSRFPRWAPVATTTWHVNFLVDPSAARAAPGGWWLLRSRAEHARDGHSSQDMALWGAARSPVLVARQSVAIYH